MNYLKYLIITTFFVACAFSTSYSQDGSKEKELEAKIETLDENVSTLLTDVASLKKLKISGYMQVQFEKSEKAGGFGMAPYDSSSFIQGRFRVRRGRLKATYDAGMTQFVLQFDATNEKLSLKDAYINITEPWLKMISLRAGVFNRPNYEVEYSSSQRESMERSTVIGTLYPGERDLGAMLTIEPDGLFQLQLAAFNNTFQGTFKQYSYPNFNMEPVYFMARATKDFDIMEGLSIDVGVHGRFGNAIANSTKVLESDQATKDANTGTIEAGEAIGRNWFGAELQLYYDFLGGMKIMGEYITGKDVNELGTSSGSNGKTIRKRDFNGYYIYFIKNIGSDWQAVVKYDSYNPNTKIDQNKIDTDKELTTNTLGFGIHNYTFSNIRLSLWYDMLSVKTTDKYTSSAVNNLLTARIQYKF